MKVWELEEGKVYTTGYENYKVVNNELNVSLCSGEWTREINPWNIIKDYDFEEVIGTNGHWKPKDKYKRFVYIDKNFDSVYSGDVVPSMYYPNVFHPDDHEKVECLALEFKIKSVLLNWRRLHDKEDIDWSNNMNKYYIRYYGKTGISFTAVSYTSSHLFGYFSTEEKAERFYKYIKSDIDKYFEMKKDLKF